jgi:methanogenic corrinoid protein MtbC1
VGATTAENEAALREVVSALKRAALQIPVLAGGRSIRDEAHARSVGADGWSGREASDAVARVNSLLAVP